MGPRGMTISIAMIVRDEASLLAECLEGAAALADEICVVDTGSTDDTVAIAERFGCTIGHYQWCDDFAAARNASLRLCTGDWVFVLDADERLAVGDIPRIRALAGQGEGRCYRFITRNYTDATHLNDFVSCASGDPQARGFAGWFPSGKVRLFPNGLGARFAGKVHELIHRSLEEQGIEVLTSEVPIHHYALLQAPERVRQKQAHYIELGRQKLQDSPQDPQAHGELGTQYLEVGDLASAVAAYREAVRLEPSNPSWLKDLGGALFLLGRREEAERALRLALQLDPNLPDAWRNLGVVCVAREAWEEAVCCFERGLSLSPEDSELCRYLAVALEGGARIGEAALHAERAVALRPQAGEALDLYVALMRRLGRLGEARAFLQGLVDSGACGADLLAIWGRNGAEAS